MQNKEIDGEYYVIQVDRKGLYPWLAWGDYDDTPFLEAESIDISEIPSPLVVEFDEPYPKTFEMADLHLLGSQFAFTEELKNIFADIYGVEFFEIDKIMDHKHNSYSGYYAVHIWNTLTAVDMQNYVGKPGRKGYIGSLTKFSLNNEILESIPLEKRLVFKLREATDIFIVHKSLYEKIEDKGFKGFALVSVDKWRETIFDPM